MVGVQEEMDLFGGMQVFNELEMPPDELVNSWTCEQQAIKYAMDRASEQVGTSQRQLAEMAGMNASQWSLLYHGDRGIPVGRFLQWTRTVGTTALQVYYAAQTGCKLITKREWGRIVRKQAEQADRIAELERENEDLKARLSPYEHVG